MTLSSDSHKKSASGEGPYLFLDVSVAGPIEELRATFERKSKMHASLGEEDAVARLARAHSLAREELENALFAAKNLPGS